MKKFVIALILSTLLLPVPVGAQQDLIAEQMGLPEISEMEGIVSGSKNIEMAAPEFDFNQMMESVAKGEPFLNPQSVLLKILKLLANEVYANLHIMLMLIILSILSAVVGNMQGAFASQGVSEAAFLTFYILFSGILIKGFYQCMDLANGVILEQVAFLKAAVPTYMSLILSTGNVTTATCIKPVFLYFIQITGETVQKLLMPVLLFVFLLSMVNNLSDKIHITKLIKFVRQIANWVLGALLTIFVAILGLSGMGSSIVDGVGLKTVKYAVGSFVPVVGGLLSDTIDTVVSSTLILKNALGVVGVVAIILMCAYPLIKMIILVGLYKLTASVVEPISDKRIGNVISSAATSVQMVFVMLLCVTVIFILAITIVIGFGNMSVMIR